MLSARHDIYKHSNEKQAGIIFGVNKMISIPQQFLFLTNGGFYFFASNDKWSLAVCLNWGFNSVLLLGPEALLHFHRLLYPLCRTLVPEHLCDGDAKCKSIESLFEGCFHMDLLT